MRGILNPGDGRNVPRTRDKVSETRGRETRGRTDRSLARAHLRDGKCGEKTLGNGPSVPGLPGITQRTPRIGEKTMKHIYSVVVALLVGFIGGVIGGRINIPRERAQSEQVIRSRSFELVDERGQVISFWGIDKGQNAVLAFGSHWPSAEPGAAGSGSHAQLQLDEPDDQRVAIGVIDDLPFFHMRGADGKTRVRLYLSIHGKPFLLMEDETGPRLSLGVEQSDTPGPQDNDWSLAFLPDRARIGMYTERRGGQTYVRGSFAVHQDAVKYPYRQP